MNGNITYDSDSINEKKDYMSMIEEFMGYNMIRTTYQVICHIRNCMIT